MESDESHLHPNWRALSTIHIPYKIFVKSSSGGTQGQGSDSQPSTLYQFDAGTDAHEFYESIITSGSVNERTGNLPSSEKCKVKHLQPKRVVKRLPFNQNEYFHAATHGNVSVIESMDLREPTNINGVDQYGWSALMMAAFAGHLKIIELLIDKGIDVSIVDSRGNSAISLAAKQNHQAIIDLLNTSKLIKHYCKHMKSASTETNEIAQPFHCEICSRDIRTTSKTKHEASIDHQVKDKNSYQFPKRHFQLNEKNPGYSLMVKQGWNTESGLGPDEKGPLFPVKTTLRKNRLGFGMKQEAQPRVTHFGPFDRDAVKWRQPQPRAKNGRQIELAATMARKSGTSKTLEILIETESVADKILSHKQEIIELDKRRQHNREAIRDLGKMEGENKVWITIGSLLVKMERPKAIEMLKKDQVQLDIEINKLRSEQKLLVNQHRDLEHQTPLKHFDLKPLGKDEMGALKANLNL